LCGGIKLKEMLYTGKHDQVTNEYDLDHKITEVVELTKKHIADLIEEVGLADYNKIAKVVAMEYIDAMGVNVVAVANEA
jgi:hypothetical protein